MAQDLVTYRTGPADTARERVRLWRAQTAFSAALAGGTVALVWYAVVLGGGAGVAGSVLAAALAGAALGAAPAAWLAARARRRPLLWGGPLAAGLVLLGAAAAGPAAAPGLIAAFAAALGMARAVFDAAATDVLHHLVDPERKPRASGDLTARFGRGQPLGLAAILVVGLAAGPRAAVVVAAGLAVTAAAVALGHHRDLDIRVPGPPLGAALRDGLRVLRRESLLASTVGAGALGVALGSAQAAVLIVWLRDGVGLRGTLAPALLAGLLAIRLARPLLVRMAAGRNPRRALVAAFGLQGAASLTALTAEGAVAGAAAYGLALGAGACLAVLVNRVRDAAGPPELAPALGMAGSVAWGLAGCAGAVVGAVLAVTTGLAETHVVLASVAAAGAAAVLARVDRPARTAVGALAPGGRRSG